jgi:LPS-assembly protein
MVRATARPLCSFWRTIAFALGRIAVVAAMLVACGQITPSFAQPTATMTFPPREKPVPRPQQQGDEQMLVRAAEINYDYTNERVSAVGNVQIYYGGSTLEADRVIYDQKTKRLHAEGNVRLTQADGTVTYGEIMDLSDDFRDGFVDSLRLDGAEQTRFAATRADRSSGNYTVFENGVYTACEPCKDDPLKPPKWQVKAARIIHDQGEKMMYFEDAKLEFSGVPLAYIPYFSAPDPTVKRKTGFLVPSFSTSSVYGFGAAVPYYFALAPDYDATFTPMITTKQGPLLQGEFRQRFLTGSYTIRGTGLFQLDKSVFTVDGPGYRDWRGSVESSGQFNLSEQWVWGWDGTVVSDQTYMQDYRIQRGVQVSNFFSLAVPDYAPEQLYLTGRGERSYFDIRGLYFYGFSTADTQSQLPILHPVMDHDYVFKSPVLGGELAFHNNLTSLSRTSADFDPITTQAANLNFCSPTTADPSVKNSNNCLLRGVPGNYTRFSNETTWRRSVIDPFGQVFTPFLMVRADAANINVSNQLGVSNFIQPGQADLGRVMPTAGVEYHFPLIAVQSWGTQTIEPIAQLIFRPNETHAGSFPNEDAQSLIFDDSNLFKVDKFSGWDRIEGGGRANVGVQYTAQFNRGGNFNFLFGESYQLYGHNSFALANLTNTGLDSGLDKPASDFVARASYQPNSLFTFTSRYRFDERTLALERVEMETIANFGRWTTSLMYGNYAAQPELGFLDRREGLLGSARLKLSPEWVLFTAARYDLHAGKISQSQIGLGYVDDCLILALNYITDYAYSGSLSVNHTFAFQIGLRTLGGSTTSQGASAFSNGIPGINNVFSR